mgnify:CR=1 FL=1
MHGGGDPVRQSNQQAVRRRPGCSIPLERHHPCSVLCLGDPGRIPSPCPVLRSPAATTELRGLWHLAWPILVGQLAYVGMAVVEVAMAGHASVQEE